jgi:hypothetical protein
MKKTTSNLIVNLQNNFISFQKPLFLNIKRATFLCLFILFSTTILAQNEPPITPKVTEVESYVSSLKIAEKNSNLSFSNAKNVEDLVYNIQPCVYFYSGELKSYGDKPKKLYTDIASLKNLATTSILKNNIEIVVIKFDNISNFNSTVDLDLFSEFTKLKYIYIVSSVNTTEQNIAKIFLNYDEQYGIFYKIDKGE